MSLVLGLLKAVRGPRWGACLGWQFSSSGIGAPFTGVQQQLPQGMNEGGYS